MKRKDAPQLFEIMRTSLSGRMAQPAKKGEDPAKPPPTEETPSAPPPPSPVAPPLILPPAAAESTPAAPPINQTRPAVVPVPPPPRTIVTEPAHIAPPEPEPEPPAAIEPPPPPPPEPVFDVHPPKPRPRRKPQPFALKPPAPGLFEAGPEQRVILSYPLSLAAAALLFVLVFSAFAVGRTMTPVRPPEASPQTPRKIAPPPPVEGRDAVKMVIPPTRPVPPPPTPAPAPAKPRWTIRLLEYDVTAPNLMDEMRRSHIEPTQKRLKEAYNAETQVIEWTRSARKYIGLFYGRWDSADHPDIAPLVQKLRDLEPFNKGRKPFAACKAMQEPGSE